MIASLDNLGGRLSVIQHHSAHHRSVENSRPMVDSSAPVFSRKRRLPRPSRPPPTSDTVNDPLLLTTLGGGGKKPADTGSSIAFMLRPLAGAASVAPLPASAGAGTAAGAPLLRPRSAAAAAGFRRSPAVQAYVDAGVAIKDGVARAFVESAAASAAEHRPLRINRCVAASNVRCAKGREIRCVLCCRAAVRRVGS